MLGVTSEQFNHLDTQLLLSTRPQRQTDVRGILIVGKVIRVMCSIFYKRSLIEIEQLLNILLFVLSHMWLEILIHLHRETGQPKYRPFHTIVEQKAQHLENPTMLLLKRSLLK